MTTQKHFPLDFADNASVADKLFVTLQYLLPQHALSRAVGWLAASEIPWLKNRLIETFIRQFGVNMNEAAQPDYRAYACFNDFFTRALAEGLRPIADAPVVCPADGAVSQAGVIEEGRIFQAKGQCYTALELLGGDRALAEAFDGGLFATIYLSPRDYHRVHMPVAGRLLRSVYVPGDLYSVNAVTAENVPRLFARNERLVAVFDTGMGPMVVVLVGAMIVAGIETVWAGQVAPRQQRIDTQYYGQTPPDICLGQGDEMGRFKLGSTAIVLLPAGCGLQWQATAGQAVKMGQVLATK